MGYVDLLTPRPTIEVKKDRKKITSVHRNNEIRLEDSEADTSAYTKATSIHNGFIGRPLLTGMNTKLK